MGTPFTHYSLSASQSSRGRINGGQEVPTMTQLDVDINQRYVGIEEEPYSFTILTRYQLSLVCDFLRSVCAICTCHRFIYLQSLKITLHGPERERFCLPNDLKSRDLHSFIVSEC